MKYLRTLTIFFMTPVIFCIFLLSVAIPLFIQHFLHSEKDDSNIEYPYLASWEEVA